MDKIVCTDEQPVEENRSAAVEENNFESILVDGCLGFSLSIGNAALIVAADAISSNDSVMTGAVAALAALVAVALLRGGQLATDALQGVSNRWVGVGACSVCFVGALVFAALGVHGASAALAAGGVASSAFIYGRYLVALVRKALMLLVDVIFVYVGCALLVFSQVENLFFIAFLALATTVSLAVTIIFTRRSCSYGELVSAEDSRSRSIKTKGNNHTLFLIGFMFASSLGVLFVECDTATMVVVLGSAVGLAGVFSLLSRQIDERWYKESLKKSAAFVAALLLLPLPLVPGPAKIVLIVIYTCLVSLNVIVVLNAIVETARFNIISPIWLFGREGSVFFSGVALGGVLFAVGLVVGCCVDLEIAQYSCLVVVVVLCSYLQIRVNYQVYPFEPVIEPAADDGTAAQIEQEGKRKLLWHRKIEAACDRYKLSPREREVLRILLKGRDAKYIMDKFYISQSTAKTHIYNIYRKFGIHSRQELLDFVEEIEVSEEEESSKE